MLVQVCVRPVRKLHCWFSHATHFCLLHTFRSTGQLLVTDIITGGYGVHAAGPGFLRQFGEGLSTTGAVSDIAGQVWTAHTGAGVTLHLTCVVTTIQYSEIEILDLFSENMIRAYKA